jgi:hypothetical protein
MWQTKSSRFLAVLAPFADAYRTLCVSPRATVKSMFIEIKDIRFDSRHETTAQRSFGYPMNVAGSYRDPSAIAALFRGFEHVRSCTTLGRRRLAAPIVSTHRELLDSVALRHVADAGRLRHANRALRRHLNLGLDKILVPVALARGNIPRKCEARESRHRDVVGPANSCLKHPAAPHRDRMRPAGLLYTPRFAMTSDASKLDIDNPAGL